MTERGSLSQARSPSAGLYGWLRRKGLSGNPFERLSAEDDRDLPDYFVDRGMFDELLHLAGPCIVFAGQGCGKTALRQMLAAQCCPLKHDSRRLAVIYTYDGFEQTLGQAHSDRDQVRPFHHVHTLLRLGLSALNEEVVRDPRIGAVLSDPDVGPQWRAYVAHFAPYLADVPIAEGLRSLTGVGPRGLLEGFTSLVQAANLEWCMVLVDGLDGLPLMANDLDASIAFLRSLLGTLPLIECPGLAFRFFLSQALEDPLRACDWFRADRLHVFHILWDRQGLLDLIGRRLVHYSQREPPYEDLAQLCEGELARVIDDDLVDMADGMPRDALRIAARLLQSHCQQPGPPELIALDTWNQVKQDWRARQDRAEVNAAAHSEMITSASPPSGCPFLRVEEVKHLVWLGEQDITGDITAQDYRVLACLYRHRDGACAKDLLAQEAWPDVVDEGVSDQAIAASVARLRRMLRKYVTGAEYVETVRGHGYRLHPTGYRG